MEVIEQNISCLNLSNLMFILVNNILARNGIYHLAAKWVGFTHVPPANLSLKNNENLIVLPISFNTIRKWLKRKG